MPRRPPVTLTRVEIEMSREPGLEVRLADDPSRLLGHLTGKDFQPRAGHTGPAMARLTGALAKDPMGAAMGCTEPDTMLATTNLHFELEIDQFTIESLEVPPGGMKDLGPSFFFPVPTYGIHEFETVYLRSAVLIRSQWRFVPVTMGQFEMLFERDSFTPVEPKIVRDARWGVPEEEAPARDPLDTLIPGPVYESPFTRTLTERRRDALDAVSFELRSPPVVDPSFTNAVTTTTTIHTDPDLTSEMLAKMRQEIERHTEHQFMSLYPPRFTPEPLTPGIERISMPWLTR